MTSWYDYQYDIKTSKPNEVTQALIKEGWFSKETDSNYDKDTGVLSASGEGSFSTGHTEETHKEICDLVKKVDPDAKVVTRWHFADEWDWDDEYGSLEDSTSLRVTDD